MTLHIRTAPYAYRGDDRLDVTRVGVDRMIKARKPAPGAPFAPSATILWPAKAHFALVTALERRAARLPHTEGGAYTAVLAEKLCASVEAAYARLYRTEMLASYRGGVHAGAWKELLTRENVTLVCFCRRRVPGPGQGWTCHRHLLTGYLVKLGAIDDGECEGVLADPDQEPEATGDGKGATPYEDLVAISGTRPPPPGSPQEHVELYRRILRDVQETVAALPAGTVLIHGDAAGVDSIAAAAGRKARFGAVVVKPWYDAFGNGAPRLRNAYVATAPRAWAWPSPWGHGTQHAIGLAQGAGVDITVRDLTTVAP